MPTELLVRTETFVKRLMEGNQSDLTLAHGYEHVNRVRNWAIRVAQGEGYTNLEQVEAAALLHDIGLALMTGNDRGNHGVNGAEAAAAFLQNNSNLSEDEISLISDAIRYHVSSPAVADEHLVNLGNKGRLLQILRDADNLDAFGASGLIRAFASHYNLPEYNPENIKGETWGITEAEFRQCYGIDLKTTLPPVHTMVGQVNQQIGYYQYLHTATARNLAQPLIAFMKDFVLQLECEITHRT